MTLPGVFSRATPPALPLRVGMALAFAGVPVLVAGVFWWPLALAGAGMVLVGGMVVVGTIYLWVVLP